MDPCQHRLLVPSSLWICIVARSGLPQAARAGSRGVEEGGSRHRCHRRAVRGAAATPYVEPPHRRERARRRTPWEGGSARRHTPWYGEREWWLVGRGAGGRVGEE
jgi:hypothetical protein